jgi:glutamyl-tRNA(Gln) amidotransferase subunit E
MTTNNNEYYTKIGLVSGIEIHAQLEGKKLFCDCPTKIRDDKHDFEVKRKLKAVIGETGEIDVAAAKETAKAKTFVYRGYNDTTCLVETDEEPPHLINKGALNLCLQVCKFLNCKVVDEIQVMRKTVIDGSNTSGFQRTSLVGYDGYIEITNKKVRIASVCLEEDAAQIVERTSNFDVYNLSRLGIPLIEIATQPDLKTPEEIKEAAEKIGMILRSLSEFEGTSIKRGLGTIRQDVNISVTGGKRVEIKGAQDLKMIPTIAEYESSRQLALIGIKHKIESHEIKLKVKDELTELNDILKHTECKFVKDTIKRNDIVMGIRVPDFKGILGQETMPERRIGTEISDYAKLAGVGGIIHSDEHLDKYRFTKEEIDDVKKILGVEENDAFIMIADAPDKVKKAFEYVIERINMFKEGVIKEVRKPNENGTTSYMRPMPGGARMYPETDTLPIKVNLQHITLGETIEDKAKKYQKHGIKDINIAIQTAKNYSIEFEKIQECISLDANTIASNLISGASLSTDLLIILPIFKAIEEEKIAKNSYLEILQKVVKDKLSVEDAIKSKQTLSKEDIAKLVDKVITENPAVDASKIGFLIGKVMALAGGKADGKTITELLIIKLAK